MDQFEPVKNQIKKPVFWSFSFVLVVIYALYSLKVLKKLPCENTLIQRTESNFVHVSFAHLAVNLWSFWVLSSIETRIGSSKYLGLILTILGISSFAEFLISKARKNDKCSIGFSGVLYGLVAWDLVSKKGKIDWEIITSLGAMLIMNSVTKKNVSFQGHAVGALTGLGMGLIAK